MLDEIDDARLSDVMRQNQPQTLSLHFAVLELKRDDWPSLDSHYWQMTAQTARPTGRAQPVAIAANDACAVGQHDRVLRVQL